VLGKSEFRLERPCTQGILPQTRSPLLADRISDNTLAVNVYEKDSAVRRERKTGRGCNLAVHRCVVLEEGIARFRVEYDETPLFVSKIGLTQKPENVSASISRDKPSVC
jgi:hypothetical protein